MAPQETSNHIAKQQDNTSATITADAGAPVDIMHYEPPPGMECKRVKTTAEKIFDTATYGGIGWIGNAALSTSLAYFFRHSKSGKPFFDKGVKTISNTFSPGNPNFEKAVNKNGEVASLIVGGTSLMLPVKVLEDNKAHVVRFIDKILVGTKSLIGIKETPAEHLEKEAAFDLLEREPKQSWGSILRARAVGLIAVFATLNAVGERRNQKIENFVADAVTEKYAAGNFKPVKPQTMEKISRLATLDVLYSIVAAVGLYVDSHLINPPKKDKKIQPGTLSPLSPPNTETHWVGHAKTKTSSHTAKMQAPSGFVQAEQARESMEASPQR